MGIQYINAQEFTSAKELFAHYKALRRRFARQQVYINQLLLKADRLVPKPEPALAPEPLRDTPRVELVSTTSRHERIKIIIQAACLYFRVSRSELLSQRRHAYIVTARHVAIYVAKLETPCSLPELGRKFGNRDHTTIMHAVNRIAALVESDEKIRADVEALRALFAETP